MARARVDRPTDGIHIRVPQPDGVITISSPGLWTKQWSVTDHLIDVDPADVDIVLASIPGAVDNLTAALACVVGDDAPTPTSQED